MAAMLVLGFAVGTWMSSPGETVQTAPVATAATPDERPRPPAGAARLLVDQGFERFGERAGTPERTRVRARVPALRPTSTGTPAREEQAGNEGS